MWLVGLCAVIAGGVAWWSRLLLLTFRSRGAPQRVALATSLLALVLFVALGAQATHGPAGAPAAATASPGAGGSPARPGAPPSRPADQHPEAASRAAWLDGPVRAWVAWTEDDAGPQMHPHPWALDLEILAHWKVEVVLLVVCIALAPARLRWRLLPWVGAFAGVGLAALTCKNAMVRLRPPDAMELLPDYSFPSGHASITLVFLAGLAVELGAGRAMGARVLISCGAALVTLLVGFSRLVLRVHWPSDVIGGFLLGSFWAGLGALEAGHRCEQTCAHAAEGAAAAPAAPPGSSTGKEPRDASDTH